MDTLAPGSSPPETLIGPWRILKKRGSGAYGTVFLVEHIHHPEAGVFALKLAHHPRDGRFEREARLLSLIESPHVPRLHDLGSWIGPDGTVFPYLVMDFIEGTPLYEYARRRPLTSREALRLLAQVARALEATHRHGVHRDLKGDNILVREDGSAFLTDFGCGWHGGAQPLTDGVVPPGTPQYRSPQVLRFQYRFRWDPEAHYEYTPQDDLYALGVTAYRLVTRTYPPPGTAPDCNEDPYQCPPPPLLAPRELVNLCPELDALILRMLAEEPQRRGSASELAQALEKASRSAGRRADRPITPSPSAAPTEPAARPGPPPDQARIVRLLATGLLATGTWAVMATLLPRNAPTASGETWSQVPYEAREVAEERDGGTAEVADAAVYSSALASAAPYVGSPELWPAVTLDMPEHPLPKQKRPPCKPRAEVEINGGCWVQIGTLKAPCREDGYEWKGACYFPMRGPEHSDTSTK